jgi:hypothetical protein
MNKELRRKSRKRWFQEHKEQRKKYNRQYSQSHKEQRKEVDRIRHRKAKYGISTEQFNQLRMAQDNKCAICQRSFIEEPHVDHDHTTGKVRGLLCHHCNTMLGLSGDNPVVLMSGIRYLETSKIGEVKTK